MSARVHELAKDLKLSSKELLDKLKPLKTGAKTHMSVLTDEEVKRARDLVKKPASPAKTVLSPKPAVKEPSKSERPLETPSIASVKKEFLLQRIGVKNAQQLAETARRVQATPSPSHKASAVPSAMPKARPVAPPSLKKKPKPLPPAPQIQPLATAPTPAAPVEIKKRKVQIESPIAVKDFAARLSVKPNELIQRLIRLNIFATINQAVNFEIASKIASDLGVELEELKKAKEQEVAQAGTPVDQALLAVRAPIVTFMGHVDHGKTSLLDAIRKTKVAASEAGGITQHIGAYEVFLPKGAITFLDTPGHEAFTAMRARGAKATDVVVLVVAADDGVMPQTIEAIDHAKAADVPILVAINKMDLPSANPDRVKKALMEYGLTPEDWGGKTVMIGVSAKTGKGIEELLEMLALESELLELKANPSAMASGVVIEAQISKESGVLATVLVQDGTLRVGDAVIVGDGYCRVRAMINDRGQRVKQARPSTPVEILGLPGVPKAGDRFYVVKDERKAKEIIEARETELRAKGGQGYSHVTLEHLFENVRAGKTEELKLIIKSDVQGSVEALRTTLGKIQSKNVRLNIIHSGTGDVSESDVMLAAASDAVVIGFHVEISSAAREIAEREMVDVRFYQIIYEVKTAIEKAMEGLLEPELKESFVGTAEVRQVFKVSKIGTIAGCTVQKGKIVRNYSCRVLRNGQKVHEGKVASLKRFKDDAREVLEGFECGIGVSNFNEILAGDKIEVFEIEKKARKLE
ncbi:MAG: translation initiation factor IF-2 [Candidatus Omnitrophica bacterium]|nr:translation initiation factor IF-2 [Candidatus Omnitrophota bacterium]